MSHARTEAGGHRGPADLALTVRRLARDRDRWTPLVRFEAARRWYTLLEDTPAGQAWLLTWLPGQSTHLHDHGGSAGAFEVVTGVLTERSVDLAQAALSRPTGLTYGRVRSFGPEYVHHLTNDGVAPAVSIHVYAPAITFMRQYALDPRAGLVEVGREKAGVDW